MNIRPAHVGDAAAIASVHMRAWQQAYRGIVPDEYGRVTLWVLSANARAVRFYAAAGFIPALERSIEIGGTLLPEIR